MQRTNLKFNQDLLLFVSLTLMERSLMPRKMHFLTKTQLFKSLTRQLLLFLLSLWITKNWRLKVIRPLILHKKARLPPGMHLTYKQITNLITQMTRVPQVDQIPKDFSSRIVARKSLVAPKRMKTEKLRPFLSWKAKMMTKFQTSVFRSHL